LLKTLVWVELEKKALNCFESVGRKFWIEASIKVARGYHLRFVESGQTTEHPPVIDKDCIDLAVGGYCENGLSVVRVESAYIDQPSEPEHFTLA
jgi:hypothetical protein